MEQPTASTPSNGDANDPRKLFLAIIGVGGTIFAGISLAKLLHLAFTTPLSNTLGVIFYYYQRVVNFFFGWIPELLAAPIAAVKSFFRIEIDVQSHWIDVFVIQNLHWGAACRLIRNRWALVFNVAIGLMLSLISSLACGLVAAGTPIGDLLIAVIGILGMLLFTLSRSLYGALFHRPIGGRNRLNQLWINVSQKWPLVVGATILIVAAPAARLVFPAAAVQFGLVGLLSYFLFVAGYWLATGFILAPLTVPMQGTRVQKWLSSRNGDTRYSFFLLAAVAGAVTLLLFNAGLGPLGL